MNQITKNLRSAAGGISLSLMLVLTMASTAFAAPSGPEGQAPPANSSVTGPQDKPAIEPGSRDAKPTEKLGSTEEVKVDAQGKPVSAAGGATTMAGAVANVDFTAPLNYCSNNLVYTPVKNTTAVSKSIKVRVYNQGAYREMYTSVAANSTAYPAFYGVTGSYTAYLYVLNGSTYQYDEYKTGSNVCNVSVTRTANSGGWVQLKIQNLGTAYASQRSTELAPFPGTGTYTGTKYDYPVAGGAAIYRTFWVGTSPYGIVSNTLGSTNSPYFFTGDL
jgi:hypothetical protein